MKQSVLQRDVEVRGKTIKPEVAEVQESYMGPSWAAKVSRPYRVGDDAKARPVIFLSRCPEVLREAGYGVVLWKNPLLRVITKQK